MIVKQSEMEMVKSHAKRAMVFCAVGFGAWLLEFFLCDFLLNRLYIFPHFHAMWHLFTALSFLELALIQIYMFLMKMNQKPRFVTFCSITIGVDCEGQNKSV